MPDERCIINPERDCIGKAAAMELEVRIKALESWRQDSKDFHEKFYDWQRQQIARESRLDEQLSVMDKNINKLVEWQEGQQSAPKKRMDALFDKVIWAVLAAVIAFMLARIGL